MKTPVAPDPKPPEPSALRWRWPAFLAVGFLLILLAAILLPRHRAAESASNNSGDRPEPGAASDPSGARSGRSFGSRSHHSSNAAVPAAEVVSAKLKQFARVRRETARAMARKAGVPVPDAVEKFFDAVEGGDWAEIKIRFDAISGGDRGQGSGGHSPDVEPLWPAIVDAYGVAEQVHQWPAQKLLDYGNSVMDSLRPGMVYVGGTDDGRWIPTLMNETSEGERHIVITQNALADNNYRNFISVLYPDQWKGLTQEDVQGSFDGYYADVIKRLAHDQQFPDEPKQIRPGENVKGSADRLQVSGVTAVMAINESMLHQLMEKNPDLSFAIQESFSFPSMYANAAPLGPIMELGVKDEQKALTPERAAQSMDYWRTTTEQLLADPESSSSSTTLKSYSHLVMGQANLFADRNYSAEAEQAYRLATRIYPGSSEATIRLANLLNGNGQADEARQLLESFKTQFPKEAREAETKGSFTITTTKPRSAP